MFELPKVPGLSSQSNLRRFLTQRDRQLELLIEHLNLHEMVQLSIDALQHDPRKHGSCPTWWCGKHVWRSSKCALDSGHAAPHVDFETAEVCLGHEKLLHHIYPARIIVYVSSQLSYQIVPDSYVAFSSSAIIDWWRGITTTHDHLTCGMCPKEVW